MDQRAKRPCVQDGPHVGGDFRGEQPFGRALLWALVVGLAAMTLWRLCEAAFGQTVVGGEKWSRRLGSLGMAVFYAVICVGVVRTALVGGSSGAVRVTRRPTGVLGGGVIASTQHDEQAVTAWPVGSATPLSSATNRPVPAPSKVPRAFARTGFTSTAAAVRPPDARYCVRPGSGPVRAPWPCR
ncbi:DUF1206 domain-containing protein [Streptomyces sp. NPDC093795]|uniref:DUF1206 domain-containing protein n=1 Tax=Streptomyces sp. NPDC093795 TaxID=3366051 RepID=UPI0037F2BFDC